MFDGWKSIWSLIIGAVLGVLGLIPLLQQLGISGLALPAPIAALLPQAVAYLIALGGVYLLIDAWDEWGEWYFWLTAIVGVLALGLGAVLVLQSFGVLGFSLPALSLSVYHGIFVIESLLLIWGAFNQ